MKAILFELNRSSHLSLPPLSKVRTLVPHPISHQDGRRWCCLGLICICLEVRESSPFQKLIGDLDISWNVRNVVHGNLMSVSANPVISGSISVDSFFITGCEFQPCCLSSRLSLHASCRDFYLVGVGCSSPLFWGTFQLYGDS